MRWRQIRRLFATKTKDFITAVDEKNIIVVKEVEARTRATQDLEKIAQSHPRHVQLRRL